jgi:cell division septum initiation protein DivIVA
MNAYSQLKTQNEELSMKVSSLDQQLATKQSEIGELNEKYKVLKMAKSLEGVSTENKDVKLKINEMVREIDKCIALLNK